jgi:predicted nucleotidyltransferase/HEPN domain-containing protein
MRTDLDHLPPSKRDELERVVAILFEEFRAAHQNATGKRKGGKILKIILFGSHARGDWVDAPSSANQYRSDYDLLVIVNQKELADRATYWTESEERLVNEHLVGKTIGAPANFIVHSLQEVNDGLAHGRVFFMEVRKEGIALYQSDDRELREPVPKTPQQALETAKEYFDVWLARGSKKLHLAQDAIGHDYREDAAFLLQQSVECLYQCIMLTLTFYTPYNHNIKFLRSQAERLDQSLFSVWPRSTKRDRALFQKLKDAYVKARYSTHYRISREELDWLGARVENLGQRAHDLCSARIAALEAAAGQ